MFATKVDSTLSWMYDRKGNVTYSMIYRNGPSSFDCSSAVYYSLIQGGFFPANIRIGNTDSLFGDLERNGFEQVLPDASGNIDTRRGDVFIWGQRGQSSGAAGHTGHFINATDIIHCAYGYNGIAVTNHDWLAAINNVQYLTVYRYNPSAAPAEPAPSNPVDQELAVGSLVQFSKVYRADDVQYIDGMWQVATNELCRTGFTWADNGIPAEPIVEVDAEGYQTHDQELEVGTLYVIPGKYRILDLGQHDGMWLGQVEAAGVKFWVDIETLTEIPESDPGKPVPAVRPPVVKPTDPVIVTPPVVEVPPMTTPPTPPVIEPPVVTPEPTKDQEQDIKINGIMDLLRAIGAIIAAFLANFTKKK